MKRVYVYILLAAILFGTMEVALKVAGGDLDSFQLTFLRFMVGGLMLLPNAVIEIRHRGTRLDLKDFAYLLLLGVICIPISMVFFQLGVEDSHASTAAVLFCINPIFTMILAHFMADEKLNMRKALAIALGLVGVIFMIRPWDIQDGNTLLGMMFTIAAALLFSLYTVMGKNSVRKLGIMAQTSISFILGSLVLLVIMLFIGAPVTAGVAENIWLVAYIGIFVTGLGYLSYFLAIKYSDAGTGSIAFFIKPAISPIIAVIFLRENLLWNTIVGIVLILAASFINLRERKGG